MTADCYLSKGISPDPVPSSPSTFTCCRLPLFQHLLLVSTRWSECPRCFPMREDRRFVRVVSRPFVLHRRTKTETDLNYELYLHSTGIEFQGNSHMFVVTTDSVYSVPLHTRGPDPVMQNLDNRGCKPGCSAITESRRDVKEVQLIIGLLSIIDRYLIDVLRSRNLDHYPEFLHFRRLWRCSIFVPVRRHWTLPGIRR